MQTMGFTGEEQKEIFRILSGILYLGNIHFTNDAKDQAQIGDKQSKSHFFSVNKSQTLFFFSVNKSQTYF